MAKAKRKASGLALLMGVAAAAGAFLDQRYQVLARLRSSLEPQRPIPEDPGAPKRDDPSEWDGQGAGI